jgi:hypothetical protein
MKKLALVFLISIFLFSCSKEESEFVIPTRAIEFTPEFNQIELTDYSNGLNGNNSSALGHLTTINSFLNFPVSLMSIPTSYLNFTSDDARVDVDSSYSFTWENGSYSVVYTYSYNDEVINYTYLAYVDDALFYNITGFQYIDGSQGAWTYDLNYSALGIEGLSEDNFTMNFYWQMTGKDAYDFNMFYDFGSYNWAFNISLSPVSSTYSQFNDGVLIYSSTWNNDNGSYTVFNSDGTVSSAVSW